MAHSQCMRTLNPPKTPLHNHNINIDQFPASKLSFSSSFSSFEIKPKPNSTSKNYPKISFSAMCSHNQNHQQPLYLDDLVTSSRKKELLGHIKTSLSNCLKETNLHLTVPGLKSKIRGKVISHTHFVRYLATQKTESQ